MYDHGMVAPVLALIGWTFVMWVWMYATRIPAMQAAKVDMAELTRTGKKLELPAQVSRVADNYNHLHEQPTIFYALALAAQVAGAADSFSIGLAWTYVLLRIAHSCVQATVNIIPIRFTIFTLGSITLLILLVRTVTLLGSK